MKRALYQKLGIKEDHSICVINPPVNFNLFFEDVPFSLQWRSLTKDMDYIHFFPQGVPDLESGLQQYQNLIQPNGMIWVSWFKKSSGRQTDINENIIRDTALSLKLVDVKVCSVNDEYSALKLVIRKHLR